MPVRVAVVQSAPVAFDREFTLAKVRQLTQQAAARGAKLVVFPEAFVSAYPRGMTFGAVIGDRSPEGRDWYRRYWESSVDIPGEATDTLADIARESAITSSSASSSATAARSTAPSCSSRLTVTTSANIASSCRPPVSDSCGAWATAARCRCSRRDIGKLGAAICWENYMPLYRTALYAKGVQLYLAPTADSRESWVASMRHIALEGRCFVLSSNQFARRSDYPSDYPSDFAVGSCRRRHARWQLHRESSGRDRCRARLRSGRDPHCRSGSERRRPRQVRPRQRSAIMRGRTSSSSWSTTGRLAGVRVVSATECGACRKCRSHVMFTYE